MTEPDNTQQILNSFIGYLYALRDDDNRAALASLRRGIGQPPGSVAETARIVERQLTVGTREDVRNACYIIGSLFALHSKEGSEGGKGNMGKHLRELCGDVKPGEKLPGNIEGHFMELRASDIANLPDALRHAVTLLKSKAVPVDWFQLAQDVQRWHSDLKREWVRKKWGESFWNDGKPKSGDAQPVTNNQ